MQEGNYVEASKIFAQSDCENAKANSAVIDILNGNYKQAADKLAGTGNSNEGLAFILSNQLDKASAALTEDCPCKAYQRAIVAARKGDAAKAQSELKNASANEELAKRAATDIEFAKVK